jgi:hypothetical protein
MSFMQSPRWTILLWQARTRESVVDLSRRLYGVYLDRIGNISDGRYYAFVERVSPFSVSGYDRVWLRRALLAIRFPLTWAGVKLTRAAARFTLNWPSAWPGRFSGYDASTQMKADYILDECDWTVADGDAGEWIWFGAYLDLEVPWSTLPESWFFTIDTQGFVGIYPGTRDDALNLFDAYQREWELFAVDDEDEPTVTLNEEDHYAD